jgi:hypothetical protein
MSSEGSQIPLFPISRTITKVADLEMADLELPDLEMA